MASEILLWTREIFHRDFSSKFSMVRYDLKSIQTKNISKFDIQTLTKKMRRKKILTEKSAGLHIFIFTFEYEFKPSWHFS